MNSARAQDGKSKSLPFRMDVNALRAIAVIAVVLYHFNVWPIVGGFVGVDIFFVISGFLMTNIVVKGIENKQFNILDFLLSRGRRIIPALFIVIISLLLIGYFTLISYDYLNLAKHAKSAILFYSNLHIRSEVGYFDSAATDKWLLHTWSLSVEWQFYLLLPIFLVLIHRISVFRNNKIALIFSLTLLSFAFCLCLSFFKPSAAFFWLPSRAWELLLGSLVAIAPADTLIAKNRNISFYTGCFLICASLILIDHNVRWPGIAALVPTLATALILLAAKQNNVITSNFILQKIGDWSYSIYLWHWPVVVLLHYVLKFESAKWKVTGIIVSLILGYLSFLFIEVTSRKWIVKLSNPVQFVLFSCMSLTVLLISYSIVNNAGLPGRLAAEIESIAAEKNNINPRSAECLGARKPGDAGCVYGGPKIRLVVIGDSHANSIVQSVAKALPNEAEGVLELSTPACQLSKLAVQNRAVLPDTLECAAHLSSAYETLDRYDYSVPVLLIYRASIFLKGINEDGNNIPAFNYGENDSKISPKLVEDFTNDYIANVCKLASQRTVYILKPIPEFDFNVPFMIARSKTHHFGSAPKLYTKDYISRHVEVLEVQTLASIKCGAKLLDPAPVLCGSDECKSTHLGRPIYSDNDHLSEYGNKLLSPLFEQIFVEHGSAQSAPLTGDIER